MPAASQACVYDDNPGDLARTDPDDLAARVLA
jgi:hypothetical protein